MNLHDLVEASDRTEKVERLLSDWRDGACKAIGAVEERMLGLDISDLAYLDYFRLAQEGTSIGEYLLWFLNASLASRVTEWLDAGLWDGARRLRLVEAVDEEGKVDPSALSRRLRGRVLLSRRRMEMSFGPESGIGR